MHSANRAGPTVGEGPGEVETAGVSRGQPLEKDGQQCSRGGRQAWSVAGLGGGLPGGTSDRPICPGLTGQTGRPPSRHQRE